MSRKDLRVATQILTGRAALNYHLSKLKRTIQPISPLCKAGKETVFHFRGQCPVPGSNINRQIHPQTNRKRRAQNQSTGSLIDVTFDFNTSLRDGLRPTYLLRSLAIHCQHTLADSLSWRVNGTCSHPFHEQEDEMNIYER